MLKDNLKYLGIKRQKRQNVKIMYEINSINML